MLYILNVILPTKRNFKNSITALYGIGQTRAKKLASVLGLHPSAKIEEVDQRQLNKLGGLIEKSFLTDFELKRKISLNLGALKKVNVLRAFLMKCGLPARGQRTHTNASTANKLSRKLIMSQDKEQRSSYSFSLSSRFTNKRRVKTNKNNNTTQKKNNKKK